MNVRKHWTSAVIVAFAAAVLVAAAMPASAEDDLSNHKLVFGVKPLQNPDMAKIQHDSDAATGLKMWSYSIKSTRNGSKGKSYKGVMVGASPISTSGTTTTTVYVVPLIFEIDGKTLDPTKPDAACMGGKTPLTVLKGSPMIVATHDFKMNGVDVGKAQYSDAFQRANFWKDVSANGGTYHNKLNYKYLPAITIKPGSAHSGLFSLSGACIDYYGGIDINWFDSLVTGTIIPSLASKGVGPTNLPIFMLYNTTMYDGSPSQCCIGGYHGAFGSPVQTYSPFQFDSVGVFGAGSEDTAIMAHEVDEWQDDPLGTNPTPPWGNIGQVSGCQGNLEVGDPLSGTDFPNVTLGGYTYHLQELAFFSWFYGSPSIGAGGKYSDNHTFTAPQGACSAN
ncbi:MAG TPA: hypothetical protein VF753_05805 [Terriglobales bacterium]